MNSTKVSKRILALDILRGVTIAGMIMVNNPGSWGHIYAPLRHAEWNGLTMEKSLQRTDSNPAKHPLNK